MKILSLLGASGEPDAALIASELAKVFAGLGKRILLVDLDPAALATQALLKPSSHQRNRGVRKSLLEGAALAASLVSLEITLLGRRGVTDRSVVGLSVAPASPDLRLSSEEESRVPRQALRESLRPLGKHFDAAILTAAPLPDFLAERTILASDWVVLSIPPTPYTGGVMRQLAPRIEMLRPDLLSRKRICYHVAGIQDESIMSSARSAIEAYVYPEPPEKPRGEVLSDVRVRVSRALPRRLEGDTRCDLYGLAIGIGELSRLLGFWDWRKKRTLRSGDRPEDGESVE